MPHLQSCVLASALLAACIAGACSDKRSPNRAGAHAAEQANETAPVVSSEESASGAGSEEACPGAADGSELVGTMPAEWHLEAWHGSEPRTLSELRDRVVVLRFWTTSGCPHCKRTLPALQELAEEFAAEPVTFIGAFHSKPVDAPTDMKEVARVARQWGVTFPIAFDRDWRTLNDWWLTGAHRHATSVTFVIGKDGKVVHVHPGPVFHRSDDPGEAQQNSDYLAVRAAIQRAL